ncbi:hypothetical protein ACFSO7_01070 [Bacillus sp. CGMCC 1.16607]|uniref:hypothetical protein n=1 Tax=Bacillus sp. CGMCC 1.16607 TaxID=3351842 RepID=UPI0036363FCD
MMNKKELYKLMDFIQDYYDKFQFDQKKLDAWHLVLQKYSYDSVHENLLKFVVDSPHPPKISDLVQNLSGGRHIPDDFVLDLTAGEDW